MRFKDRTGQRYGRLVAIACVGRGKAGEVLWNCLCDCGNEIVVRGYCLTKGTTRSCGCLAREVNALVGPRFLKHGHCLGGIPSATYLSWQAMRQRCTNSNCPDWKDYGARGIRVCQRWLKSFVNFLHDMGERPKGMTLDRKDNAGDYTPSNCHWATPKQQASNRRPKLCHAQPEQVMGVAA
jgi:hypothetical protein